MTTESITLPLYIIRLHLLWHEWFIQKELWTHFNLYIVIIKIMLVEWEKDSVWPTQELYLYKHIYNPSTGYNIIPSEARFLLGVRSNAYGFADFPKGRFLAQN